VRGDLGVDDARLPSKGAAGAEEAAIGRSGSQQTGALSARPMGGGMGASQPRTLVDASSLRTLLDAQLPATAATCAMPGMGLAPASDGSGAEATTSAQPADVTRVAPDSTTASSFTAPSFTAPPLTAPSFTAPSFTAPDSTTASSGHDAAAAELTTGTGLHHGAAPETRTPRARSPQMMRDALEARWTSALHSAQDWTNVLRMTGGNPQLNSSSAATHAAGHADNADFGALHALHTLHGLPLSASSAGLLQASLAMAEAPPGMNPAMGVHSRSPSEALLAELTMSARGELCRGALSSCHQAPTSDGGMDDLIDSLFPISEQTSHQVSFPVEGNLHPVLDAQRFGGARQSIAPQSRNDRLSTMNVEQHGAQAPESAGQTPRFDVTSDVSGGGGSRSMPRGCGACPEAASCRGGSDSAEGDGFDLPLEESRSWWAEPPHASRSSARSANGVNGPIRRATNAPPPLEREHPPLQGSISPTGSSNSALSATDILHLGDELLDGV